jgi:hypothetical protein
MEEQKMKTSIHFSIERRERAKVLEELKAPILSVNGKLCIFIVDKGHKNGAEIHVITENGVIHIYNKNSKKYVTGLIARPGQLTRYGAIIPDFVIRRAEAHVALHYNEL